MTRDEAIEAGARALDPSAWDDALWASASGWGLLAQPSRKAEARSVVATVLDAIGWRPEVEVQAEALRRWASDLRAAYPTDVFIPPPPGWLAEVHAFCQSRGHTLDAISAHVMRHALHLADVAADALGGAE